MAAIPFTESALASLKKALRAAYPDVRSSHLTEAIAAALGRKSHAALIADLSKQQEPIGYELLVDESFGKRLQELDYPADPEFSFEWFDKDVPVLISTIPPSAYDFDYHSERERAWRNLMVCAINEGLRQQLFTLAADNYNWAPQVEAHKRREGKVFDFTLSNGLPARAYVDDIGCGELSIHAAVNPTGNSIMAWNAGFSAGDAFAAGWLEREKGVWLQSSTDQFNCRKPLLKTLANMEVRPRGFGDRGRVMT